MNIIGLGGSHYEMGRQHAHQLKDLRPQIMRAIRQRVRSLEEYEVYVEKLRKNNPSILNS